MSPVRPPFGNHVRRLALALCALAAARLPACAQPAPPGKIPLAVAVREESAGRETRLVFSIGACVPAEAHVLDNPARAIVDLGEVNFQIDPRVGQPTADTARPGAKKGRPPRAGSGKLIASYRFGRLAPGKSRIVVDLDRPAEIVAATCGESADGAYELTLALAPATEAAFKAAARAGAEKQARAALAAPVEPPPPPSATRKPVIVIDPGHGGVDTGALGHDAADHDKAVEKFVVMDFARALAAQLRRDDRYRVILTREDDRFVALGERVRVARAAGAALFVSVHADALAGDGAGVQGATVYTVSERASDAEAARVAEHENKADAAGGVEAKEDAGDVNDILFELTRRETRAYSHVFARSLAEYWKVAARLNKNPRRSAGFVVLKAPDVPSVLLELGYLSNDADSADLTSPKWREKAADQAARAIDAFFAARPAPAAAPAPSPDAALKATQSGGN